MGHLMTLTCLTLLSSISCRFPRKILEQVLLFDANITSRSVDLVFPSLFDFCMCPQQNSKHDFNKHHKLLYTRVLHGSFYMRTFRASIPCTSWIVYAVSHCKYVWFDEFDLFRIHSTTIVLLLNKSARVYSMLVQKWGFSLKMLKVKFCRFYPPKLSRSLHDSDFLSRIPCGVCHPELGIFTAIINENEYIYKSCFSYNPSFTAYENCPRGRLSKFFTKDTQKEYIYNWFAMYSLFACSNTMNNDSIVKWFILSNVTLLCFMWLK